MDKPTVTLESNPCWCIPVRLVDGRCTTCGHVWENVRAVDRAAAQGVATTCDTCGRDGVNGDAHPVTDQPGSRICRGNPKPVTA